MFFNHSIQLNAIFVFTTDHFDLIFIKFIMSLCNFFSKSHHRSKSSSTSTNPERKSSSTSTNPERKMYNVYLSCCKQENSFYVDSLHRDLSSKPEIIVFWDDGRRDREEPTSVLDIIAECKVAVIVFSRKYFNSRWCLQVLKKITECCQTTAGLIVIPVIDRRDPVDPAKSMNMYDCMNRIPMEEISQEEDKVMSCVSMISYNNASKFLRLGYL